ncbi:MAG: NAD(P)-binding protein [Acidobacteriota bacterium]
MRPTLAGSKKQHNMMGVSNLSGIKNTSHGATYDAIIAGGGPAGLAAAEALAKRRCSALVLEQSHEIGSPMHTSGGSFIDELEALSIPAGLYHPISITPGRECACWMYVALFLWRKHWYKLQDKVDRRKEQRSNNED